MTITAILIIDDLTDGIMTDKRINCPYCGTELEVQMLVGEQERMVCDACKRPIMLYKSEAATLRHQDRSTRAVSLEGELFSEDQVYLEFVETHFAQPQYIQIPEGRHLLGRYNPRSEVALQVLTDDPSIDRQHSWISLNKKGWLEIEDNDSMTGTFVNGLELNPGERRRLEDGDVLILGATTAIVHLGE